MPDPEVGPAPSTGRSNPRERRYEVANMSAIGPRERTSGSEHAADDKRGAGVERRYGFVRGKSSEGENPTSVTGMKQGRREQEGETRQEVEKA